MRKAVPLLCSLFLISVFSIGCGAAGPDDTNGAEAIAGTQWQLVFAETAEGTVQADTLSKSYTINFTSEEAGDALRVGGQNVCNNYGGSYRIEGGSITIFDVKSTQAVCSKAAQQVDDALLTKVRDETSYEISGDRLMLYYEEDGEQKQIVFESTSEDQ